MTTWSRSHTVTRRSTIATAAGAAASVALPLALAAAGGEGAPAGAGAGGAKTPAKIAYWGMWGGASEQPETDVITNFQAKFPHITVEGTQASQVAGTGALDREKFIAALAAGNPPDVIKGDQLAAAWEFLKYYCYGKDAQLLFGSRTGQMPALLEAAEDKDYKQSDPRMPVFVDVMKHAKIRDVTPAGDEIWFNDQAKTRNYAMFKLGPRVLEGQRSIPDILNESEKHVNQTINAALKQAGVGC